MDWKKYVHWAVRLLDYLVPVAISAGLVIWLFHKVNFRDIIAVAREECDFLWVAMMMVITTMSHMVRGIRWGIQLRGAGVPRMSVIKESVSIFGAYALNLVFPRLGEVWRCVYISRSEKVPLSTVVGTDIGDRGSDAVVVVALTFVALAVAHPAIMSFVTHYQVGRDIAHVIDDKLLWLGIAAIAGIFWFICHYLREYEWVRKMDGSLGKVWQGFRVLFTMKGRGWYVVLTAGIWLCYYMETYVMFHAFPFTRALVEEPGSAYGLGPWNLAVMFALSLYGINDTEGAAFAMVMWSFQAVWLVVQGLFSAGYVMYNEKHRPITGTK